MAKIEFIIDGESRSISKHQLFALARRGKITPEINILIDGKLTKVGKIKGIEFPANDEEVEIIDEADIFDVAESNPSFTGVEAMNTVNPVFPSDKNVPGTVCKTVFESGRRVPCSESSYFSKSAIIIIAFSVLFLFCTLLITLGVISFIAFSRTPQGERLLVSLNSPESEDIFIAIENGNLEDVKLFVRSDSSCINRLINEKAPLHHAVSKLVSIEIIEYLIENGADVNKRGKNGFTPAHYMTFWWSSGNENLRKAAIRCLIENGANINMKDDSGLTPLHHLAGSDQDKDNSEIVKCFIECGADVNAKATKDADLGMYGQIGVYEWDTPLHICAKNPHSTIETIKCLIDNGAEIHAKNKEDRTPVDNAKNNPTNEAQKYLISLSKKEKL